LQVAHRVSFSASATMTHDGYTVTASGEPGDISKVTAKTFNSLIGDIFR
jgi:hypothetical protein